MRLVEFPVGDCSLDRVQLRVIDARSIAIARVLEVEVDIAHGPERTRIAPYEEIGFNGTASRALNRETGPEFNGVGSGLKLDASHVHTTHARRHQHLKDESIGRPFTSVSNGRQPGRSAVRVVGLQFVDGTGGTGKEIRHREHGLRKVTSHLFVEGGVSETAYEGWLSEGVLESESHDGRPLVCIHRSDGHDESVGHSFEDSGRGDRDLVQAQAAEANHEAGRPLWPLHAGPPQIAYSMVANASRPDAVGQRKVLNVFDGEQEATALLHAGEYTPPRAVARKNIRSIDELDRPGVQVRVVRAAGVRVVRPRAEDPVLEESSCRRPPHSLEK